MMVTDHSRRGRAAWLPALVLLFSLAACGSEKKAEAPGQGAATSAATAGPAAAATGASPGAAGTSAAGAPRRGGTLVVRAASDPGQPQAGEHRPLPPGRVQEGASR